MILSDIGGYYNAMDREYNSSVARRESPLSELRVRDIGISTPPFNDQVSALQARIFQGASTVELGFSGAGKGSMQGHNTTPEMYGKEEREAIRDLAKINKVNLSTHASFAAGHMSGYNPQQGQFSDAMREGTLREIERAIDFAADTAQGGAVVVHTGEFPRPLSESEWNTRKGDEFENKFKMYPREGEEAIIQFVDRETGHVERIGKNTQFYMPVWEIDPKTGKYRFDEETKLPVPEFDKDTKKFKMEKMDWGKLIELGNWYKNEHPELGITDPAQAFLKLNSELKLQGQNPVLKQYEEEYNEIREQKPLFEKAIHDINSRSNLSAKDILNSQIIPDNVKQAINNSQEKRQLDALENLKNVPEEQREELEKAKEEANRKIVERTKDMLNQTNDTMAKRIKLYGDSVVAFHQQIENERKAIERLEPIEKYALNRTADTIARAAEFAHQKSIALKEHGMLNSPIYVAPENIFPEEYGAHPEELREIIKAARDKYVEENSGKYGEAGARKLAEEHIKATMDVGHIYTWRKYFDDSKYKSFQEADNAFKEWMFREIDKLNKDKMIGHIHVSDNFGYEDEHVTPGQGRVPIREFIDRMKKAGINEVITEAAHQDYKTMLGGWKEFGAPIYSTDGSARRWTEIEHSYFGQTRSPYFIFGDYAPNQQEFTLWSQTPLE